MSSTQHAPLAPKPAVEIPAGVQVRLAHLDALDQAHHEPSQLRLLAWLSHQLEAVSYPSLMKQLHLRATTLSMQVKRLETAVLVEIERRVQGHGATAWVALTPQGRAALAHHLGHGLAALELCSPPEEAC